jgi:maleylacetate reductase
MKPFVYQPPPSRVVFRVGALDALEEEVARLGSRALVLCTPEQRSMAEEAARRLGTRNVGIFDRAVMHVPIEVAHVAREEAKRLGADCCVAIGGGSTIGLGKAIAMVSALPIIAVPTTYAGSEMTPIWGLTEGGLKRTGRDPKVQPRCVVYDPALTLTLPAGLSASSGMNAIAHCVEALYAADGNPIATLMAEEGIRALSRSLPRIVEAPKDLEARSDALYGAWLGGAVLGTVGMALHHKLCHTLGGSFGLPHAETHTVVLPHAARYNEQAVPDAMARLGRALGRPDDAPHDAPAALWDLARSLGCSTALEAIGLKHADLDRAADLAVKDPYWNPRPFDRTGLRALLEEAWHGRRP